MAASLKLAAGAKHLLKRAVAHLGYEIRPVRRQPASDRLFRAWLEALRRSGPIETVFDVGANRGQTVKLFRPHMPAALIHAFEPFELPFQELQRLAQADGRIKPFNVALGPDSGPATLHQNFVEDTNSLLPNSPGSERFALADWMKPVGRTTIQVARLDEIFRGEALERIDILKVDVQGYERQVLESAGALLHPRTIRGLMLELLFVPYYEGQAWGGEMIEMLRRRGYRLYGLSCVYYNVEHGWHWADALFVPDDAASGTLE